MANINGSAVTAGQHDVGLDRRPADPFELAALKNNPY
jgi:hypothetical protein